MMSKIERKDVVELFHTARKMLLMDQSRVEVVLTINIDFVVQIEVVVR